MINSFYFRKFNPADDLVDLFSLMMDDRDQALFHSRIHINSLVDFEKWIMNNMVHFYHIFYIISNNCNRMIGFIYSYDYRVYDGHCKICIVLKRDYRGFGFGCIYGLKFLKELFDNYPLRKIYVDVYDYNKQSLNTILGAGFIEEGCLKEYRFNDGLYYDMHIFSISRPLFYRKIKQYK